MLSKLNSMGLLGIDGYVLTVETDLAAGMPSFEVVGLPDAAVKESRERIRAALKNTGISLPAKKITVNLAPADIKKEGAYLDMAIAVGILTAMDEFIIDDLSDYAFLGELSLDGELRAVSGVLPMAISAYQNGIKKMIVPSNNAEEAAIVKELEVYGFDNLEEVVMFFTKQKEFDKTTVDIDALFRAAQTDIMDFSDVKGQGNVKRALEVAAAGGHNCLLIGPPGAGKTMLAQRLPSILPDMTFDESLEVTKIHSIANMLPKGLPLVKSRPFRNPHHTISAVGLSGGGAYPKPGEISLSHNGVLFLDELPEFRKDALEVMRQPLEDGLVTISRASGTLSYPCNVMLVASMNPCPCGYYGDAARECTCTNDRIGRYLSKVSGPLLDRIDLHVEVPAVKYKELESREEFDKSSDIKEHVNAARQIQIARYKSRAIYSNSQLTPNMLSKYCALDDAGNALLKQAYEKLGLSARAHSRILKVARTIADLGKCENIERKHVAEAIHYRSLDRKFWN